MVQANSDLYIRLRDTFVWEQELFLSARPGWKPPNLYTRPKRKQL